MSKGGLKGLRSRARRAAVEVLYRVDLMGEDAEGILKEVAARRGLNQEAKQYLQSLVKKTLEHLQRIDASLSAALTDWRLDRLSFVDRAILRLASCELLFMDSIPPRVSIDQAVELARYFGTEGSARFVNGVIDAVYKREIKV